MTDAPPDGLTPRDLDDLAAAGRDPEGVRDALRRLRGPRPVVRLHRPATLGDGILALDAGALDGLGARADEAAAAGRLSTFVPASGAATRLCAALVQAHRDGLDRLADRARAVVAPVVAHAEALAVWPEAQAAGARPGDAGAILAALVGEDGLALAGRPKALVPFHREADGPRTAFDAQLAEAEALVQDAQGVVRAHFTVSPEHRGAFEAALARAQARTAATLDVRFSVQDPATDTPAVTPEGAPFRTADGWLLFRPGGHGALLGNLAACGGDLVLLKNVDNVGPASDRPSVLRWRRALAGWLVALLDDRVAPAVRALRAGQGTTAARRLVHDVLGADLGDDPAALLDRLARPWRVCGMVPNQGAPGGGPFWAEGPDGIALQIVEGVQVDTGDPEQAAIAAQATHFNPVEIVAALRDVDGAPHDLPRWSDPDAGLVTRKTHSGRPLRALEHPGLWNGGMARWNTVFVVVPPGVFRPVKTLSDLLGRAHGGPLGPA